MDTTNTNILDILGPRGYSCRHKYSTWMPERFQAGARADMDALKVRLAKMTKAQLKAYIATFNDAPYMGEGTKADLVTRALMMRYEQLYPTVEMDSYADR